MSLIHRSLPLFWGVWKNIALEGESKLHHDFGKSNAIYSSKDVASIIEHIKMICNPLSKAWMVIR